MRRFSKGFAFVPLLIVFFLLVVSAVTSYVVINQGTGGYSSRAAGNSANIAVCSKVLCRYGTPSNPTESQCTNTGTLGFYCGYSSVDGCRPQAKYLQSNNSDGGSAYIAYHNCSSGSYCENAAQCGSGLNCVNNKCANPTSIRTCDASGDLCCLSVSQGGGYYCKTGFTCNGNTSTSKCVVTDPKPTSCNAAGNACCFRTQPNNTGYYCNSPYVASSQNSSCKCQSQDPKPVVSPDPGGGGGGGGGGGTDYGQGDGSCAATFAGATCQDTSSCTGTVQSGYCPGPATWKCCVPAGGGGGGGGGGGTTTPTPTPKKGVAPTCQLTGPNTVKIGEAVNYSATCADADNNLNKIELYWAKKGESWNVFKTCEQSASGTGTCANSFTFTSPGTYFIVANGYDASGNKCTGYSWIPIPSDWAACGENDTIIVDMGSDVTLNFTLRLQGVTAQPRGGQTVPFKVKLKGPTDKDYVSGTLTANSAGKWTGSVAFSGVTVGEDKKYTIYIKVGKHLQKRVCAINPSETSGGLYNCTDSAIALTAGANPLDFSGIMLLAGDLPSSTGEQNGVVDSYDISYILNNLGATDATKMAIGDLNFDGVIDTQDRSLIIQSLNVKYDDQ